MRYDIDYDNAQGPYELSDGTTYVLIPTKMIELPGDGTKLKDEVTVAVLIEEQWYLIGFDDNDEVQLLVAAYPTFGEPDFITNFAAALRPMIRVLSAFLAVLLLTLAPAVAREFTDDEQADLDDAVATSTRR